MVSKKVCKKSKFDQFFFFILKQENNIFYFEHRYMFKLQQYFLFFIKR